MRFLDRIFYVRMTNAGGTGLPRDRQDVLGTDVDDHSARWHVLRTTILV
ncbi:MAG: hypothetical protein ACP5H2_09370 [Solirubrobacteraceae bacterium]